MLDHVVFDVETQLGPVKRGQVGPTWDDTDQLMIGVAVVYEGKGQRFRVYDEGQRKELQKRILAADKVSGFNIWSFDYPVIFGYSRPAWATAPEAQEIKKLLAPKTNDILRRIWQSLRLNPDYFVPQTHGGYRLDEVAFATIGARKSGDGADAPRLFQEGRWAELTDYCINDVVVERDLTAFAERYGYVIAPKSGQRVTLEPWKGA